jgi:hypothetical protein
MMLVSLKWDLSLADYSRVRGIVSCEMYVRADSVNGRMSNSGIRTISNEFLDFFSSVRDWDRTYDRILQSVRVSPPLFLGHE